MAKRNRKKLLPGDQLVTKGSDMFGDRIERVLFVRPVGKSRGGGGKGDEAGVLSYRRYPSGKRTKGSVEVLPVEQVYKRFEK